MWRMKKRESGGQGGRTKQISTGQGLTYVRVRSSPTISRRAVRRAPARNKVVRLVVLTTATQPHQYCYSWCFSHGGSTFDRSIGQ